MIFDLTALRARLPPAPSKKVANHGSASVPEQGPLSGDAGPVKEPTALGLPLWDTTGAVQEVEH